MQRCYDVLSTDETLQAARFQINVLKLCLDSLLISCSLTFDLSVIDMYSPILRYRESFTSLWWSKQDLKCAYISFPLGTAEVELVL